jgi:hypothetical protein
MSGKILVCERLLEESKTLLHCHLRHHLITIFTICIYFCRLVFLGFTKCGQFVVSYSCQLLVAAEHSTLPVYVYKLQWWRFIPNSPLHMVLCTSSGSHFRLTEALPGLAPITRVGKNAGNTHISQDGRKYSYFPGRLEILVFTGKFILQINVQFAYL